MGKQDFYVFYKLTFTKDSTISLAWGSLYYTNPCPPVPYQLNRLCNLFRTGPKAELELSPEAFPGP